VGDVNISDHSILIFDLMDTVVHDPFRIIPGHLGLSMDELLKIKNPRSWPSFELGECDEEDYFSAFFLPGSGRELNGQELKATMFAAYRFIEGMEDVLSDLKQRGKRLWVHSNYTDWVEEIRQRLALDRYFEGYAVSYQLKARKPDALAYTRALEQIGCAPADAVFIDDRRTNVAAAEAVGLRGIHFTGAANLRAALGLQA
jgi:HAD superfamily hydrolase (TIGR01509 family)